MSFDIGDRIRLKAEFSDLNGNPANPTSITIIITKPSEVVEYRYYNVVGEADTISILTDPGTFVTTLDLDESGWWIWHCAGEGAIIAVEESTFKVERKKTG